LKCKKSSLCGTKSLYGFVPRIKTPPLSKNYKDSRPFDCAQGKLYAGTSSINLIYTKLTSFTSRKICAKIPRSNYFLFFCICACATASQSLMRQPTKQDRRPIYCLSSIESKQEICSTQSSKLKKGLKRWINKTSAQKMSTSTDSLPNFYQFSAFL